VNSTTSNADSRSIVPPLPDQYAGTDARVPRPGQGAAVEGANEGARDDGVAIHILRRVALVSDVTSLFMR
jgi:hypothetical protein